MTTPWQVCKRMRTAFPDMIKSAIPPMPLQPERETPMDEVATDSAFRMAGLRAASSIDNRLWSEKLSWERKAAYKKWSAIILHEIGAWEIARLEVQCCHQIRCQGISAHIYNHIEVGPSASGS